MHDPLVVAFEVAVPIPTRKRWRDARPGERRWTLGRSRRTNPENLGEPVYPWWRLKGYEPRVAGRAFALRRIATIWHVEPGGRDAFEVCKNRRQKSDGTWTYHRRWAWHVHHWHVQVHLEQALRRFLLERCELCGRRYPWGYAPISHQWDSLGSRWRDGVVRRAYHHECSSLVSARQRTATDERLIRALFAAFRVATDEREEQLLERLTGARSRAMEFGDAYRLTRLLGYERGDGYELVRKVPT